MRDLEDNQLAILAGKGDKAAFEMLLERHYATIYHMSYRWMGHQADAEDIAQEVCIKIGRTIVQFQGEASFTSWLYRIVVNTAKDWFKANKRMNTLHEAFISYHPTESAAIQEDAVAVAELFKRIHQLPEGQQEAVMLVLVEGLSHKEAAEILDCPEGTIAWRVSEARKKLEN